jgi:uncharacterized protein involved in exopolysaccharide biosynthesis
MNGHASTGSLQEALLVLVRHRRIILGVYLGVFVTACVGIFVLPPQYRAAAKVLVTSNRAEISTSAERPTELQRSAVTPPQLNSQLEIVHSADLIAGVLKDMAPPVEVTAKPGVVARTFMAVLDLPGRILRGAYSRLHGIHGVVVNDQLDPRVAAVQAGTEAGLVRNSEVIEIAFTGGNPEWAREYVSRLTAAYIERQAKMQRESEAENFFVTQSELLRQKLSDSEAALRAQREQAGALAGQQAEIHDRLNEFSADFARTRIARAEQEERVAFLERTLAADRHSGRVATPELLTLEAKRAELIGRYQPKSERVRDIDQQILNLRAAIGSYESGTAQNDAGGGSELTSARASLVALKGKEEALAKEREEYRRQAELLDSQNFDLVRLERQVKLDEEAYLSYVRTAEESRLSNALEQSKMLRLAVVEPATVPMEPVSPKKGAIILFALVGGAAVGVGVAFALDYFDKTVRTAAEVRRYADLEVLAVLPERAA